MDDPLTYGQAIELMTPIYQFMGAAAAVAVVMLALYLVIYPFVRKKYSR